MFVVCTFFTCVIDFLHAVYYNKTMFPHVTFLTLSLYDWFALFGVVGALVLFRVFADLKRIPAKVQNICLFIAVAAIAVGFLSAMLFQAVYDFIESGTFRWTGMTFYGGLIGGAATFLALYFTVGKKVCGKQVFDEWKNVSSVAAVSISFAHAMGRIGCFMVGCCYGKDTASWLGVYFPSLGRTVLPTQLFEAVFLFLLCGGLIVLLLRARVDVLAVYAIAYAVFRFVIEFWRGDDRGEFLFSALSPSQCWAIVLFLVGWALLLVPILRKKLRKGEE